MSKHHVHRGAPCVHSRRIFMVNQKCSLSPLSKRSTWNLIHKECTAFGPTLAVSVIIEPLRTTPPSASHAPPTTDTQTPPSSSAANEDLQQSIGFIPDDTSVPSYPDFEVVPLISEEIPGYPQEGAGEDSIQPAFVMVENPCSEVMSLSSTDSLYRTSSQPPPPPRDGDGVLTPPAACDSEGMVHTVHISFDTQLAWCGCSCRFHYNAVVLVIVVTALTHVCTLTTPFK